MDGKLLFVRDFRIKTKAKASSKSGVTTINVEDGEDEGLALLIPDIQETFMLVQNATSADMTMQEEQEQIQSIERPSMQSIEEKYLELMKKLQFGKFCAFISGSLSINVLNMNSQILLR